MNHKHARLLCRQRRNFNQFLVLLMTPTTSYFGLCWFFVMFNNVLLLKPCETVYISALRVWSFVDLSAVGVRLTEEILFSYNFYINILHLSLGHIFTWPPTHHATTCNAINKMTNKEANTLFWSNSYNTREEERGSNVSRYEFIASLSFCAVSDSILVQTGDEDNVS